MLIQTCMTFFFSFHLNTEDDILNNESNQTSFWSPLTSTVLIFSKLWKSLGTINCLVSHILQKCRLLYLLCIFSVCHIFSTLSKYTTIIKYTLFKKCINHFNNYNCLCIYKNKLPSDGAIERKNLTSKCLFSNI